MYSHGASADGPLNFVWVLVVSLIFPKTCPFPELHTTPNRKDPGVARTGVSTSWASICWRDFRTTDREVGGGYRVVMSDPWKNNERVTLYVGRALCLNLTDLLPDMDYAISVESTLDAAAFANITIKTHPVGFCGNEDDVKAVIRHRDTLADMVAECDLHHMFSTDDTKNCIAKGSDLSPQCTDCYFAEAKCSEMNCASKCLHSRWAESCQLCNRQNCAYANKRCSGMPFWAGATIKHHPGY